jgi:hypothetical protein
VYPEVVWISKKSEALANNCSLTQSEESGHDSDLSGVLESADILWVWMETATFSCRREDSQMDFFTSLRIPFANHHVAGQEVQLVKDVIYQERRGEDSLI